MCLSRSEFEICATKSKNSNSHKHDAKKQVHRAQGCLIAV